MRHYDPDIISFDLDGILIETAGLHDEAFLGALEATGMTGAIDAYLKLCQAEPLEAVSTREKLRRIGCEAYYAQIKEKKDLLFYDLLPKIRLNPWLRYDLERNFGAMPESLAGPKLAVITNCTESMALKLLDLAGIAGMMPLFSATGAIATKPDPALYHRAGEALGYEAGMTWLALEDSDQGIAAARAAGVSCPVKTTFHQVKERLRLCAF